ncbi:NAD(P)-binding protein [Aspergillus karnatakaensis]|uniref:NAD(P)-binding protein n=1 Tax=Aspergillus karnatakaensis TaxID=1810916 RepID=UPI003CCCCD7D
MSTATPHVLLFGGNGRVAKAMTTIMLSRSWKVTSVIRNIKQKKDKLQLGDPSSHLLDVLECDLANLRSSQDAAEIMQKIRPNIVVFAAGSFTTPYTIDRDAAQHISHAASEADSVRKLLTISFPASRRNPAPWWTPQDIAAYSQESAAYPAIKDAKLQADEYAIAVARRRETRGGPPFQVISLRPSWLTSGLGTGRVRLGRTQAVGEVSIGDVAGVAVALLGREDTRGWFDLVAGEEEIEGAVERVVGEGVDCIAGEDVEGTYKLVEG